MDWGVFAAVGVPVLGFAFTYWASRQKDKTTEYQATITAALSTQRDQLENMGEEIASIKARELVMMDYIHLLRLHIDSRADPPPPPWPAALTTIATKE